MEPGRAYLAKRLREIRQLHNESVNEVGKAVSKSGKTISAWEVGRGQPDADSLIKLCKHLECQSHTSMTMEISSYQLKKRSWLKNIVFLKGMNKKPQCVI